MRDYNGRKLITFLLTFSLSLFLTVFFTENEEPNQNVEKIVFLPEKENKKCSAKTFQDELNPIYRTYAELIQKRTEIKLWLQNNENAAERAKSNQRIRLVQTEKEIILTKKVRDLLGSVDIINEAK